MPRFVPTTAPQCARCGKSVYQAEQVIGPQSKPYHKTCLTCVVCGKRLDSTLLLEHDGDAYCKNCHRAHLGQGKGGFGKAVPLNAQVPRSPTTSGRASPTPATPGRTTGGSFSAGSPTGPSFASSPAFDQRPGSPQRFSRPASPSKLSTQLASGRDLNDAWDRPAQDKSDPLLDLADEVSQIRVSARGSAPAPALSTSRPLGPRNASPERAAVASVDDAIASGVMPKIVSRSSLAQQPEEEERERPAQAIEPLEAEPAAAPIPNKYAIAPADPPHDENYKPSAAEVIAAVRAGRVPGSPKKEATNSFAQAGAPQTPTSNREFIGSVPMPSDYKSPGLRSAGDSSYTAEPPRAAASSTAASRAPAFDEEPTPRFELPTTRVAATTAYSSPSGRLPSPTRPDMKGFERSSAVKVAPRGPGSPERRPAADAAGGGASYSPGINRLGLTSSVSNASTAAARSGTPLCARCERAVYFAEQIQASGRKWHRACLKCDGCGTSLDPGKLEEGPVDKVKSGCNTWCRVCYAKFFGPKGR